MTLRRSLGLFTLLAMMHFIVSGTAAACIAPRGEGGAASAGHTKCAPASTHSNTGTPDRPSDVPCCTALASCSAAPLVARTAFSIDAAPMLTVAGTLAERAPRAELPAPELPPPRA